MPRYLIERDIPGLGRLPNQAIQEISRKSCQVLQELGPSVQWCESYVTADRMYCIYLAPEEALVREHAIRGGFPADKILRVTRILDPTTAE